MATLLGITALIFFIAGTLLLLSPKSFESITKLTNKLLFNMDDKIPVLRRPLGIFFLALCIYLWYIALYEL